MKRATFYNYFRKQFAMCDTTDSALRKHLDYITAIDSYVDDIVKSAKISETLHRAYEERMRVIIAEYNRIIRRRERV